MELSASMLVVSIIALGMTSGAQAVMLHYQTDTVRQDLRQYGNNIMRDYLYYVFIVENHLKLYKDIKFTRIHLFKRIPKIL